MYAMLNGLDGHLHWSKVPNPVLENGQVLLEIHAAALNRADLLQRAGEYPPPPGWPDWFGLEASGIIKEMTPDETSEDICALAESIEHAVHTELRVQTVIGIGTTANHLRELADRYKEAQVAIEVGKVFENEKPVIHYDNLGIGRIIYQLPTTLCEMFLSEAFKKNPIEALDEDTLDTINRFFENNLNVSETARKLYVHRNTLVYRLEKVKKITGLDLREFEDAILFKVAVMVKKYLDSQNTAKF